MRLLLACALPLGAGLFVLGCEPPIPDYPFEGDGCSVDAGPCGSKSGGGATGTGTGAGTGVGGSTAAGTGGGVVGSSEVQGAVTLITSDCFTQPGTPFNGTANVVLQPTSGASQTSPYGGTNAMTFDFTGVAGSGVWMYVQDTSMGGSGIFSTLSYWGLPQVGAIQIPAIDSGMFSSIAAMQPSLAVSGGINVAASHVVLQLTHGGMPYAGVAVTGGFGGATLVYDQGGCFYSDGNTSTGALGTAILFNSGLSGPAQITVTDTATMQIFTIPTVLTSQGAVTIAGAEL